MTKWIGLKRKSTGAARRKNRKNKRYEIGSDYIPSLIGNTKKREIRVRGGNKKIRILLAQFANVIHNGKYSKTKILTVIENRADPHFVRRNIITKGAIIKTELGKAVVISRPGQNGIVNAKLIEEKS